MNLKNLILSESKSKKVFLSMSYKKNQILLSVLFVFTGLCGSVKSANRVLDFAQLRPLSWVEVIARLKEFHTQEDFNVDDSCPKSLSAYENQEGVPKYSYIFLKNYYWSEYVADSGKICIVQYTEFGRDKNTAAVLDKVHANLLLNAAKTFGFDESNKIIFNTHLILQKQAVRNPEALKYGGVLNIIKFMEENEPEKTYRKSDDSITIESNSVIIHTSSLEVMLEQSYSKETLEQLKEHVRKQPPDKLSSGIYPFMTMDGLIAKAKEDVKRGLKTFEDVFSDF